MSVAGPAPAGATTYTPAAGTLFGAGAGQVLTVNAAGTNDYNPATLSVPIDVNRAPLTITADNKSREFGKDNPPLTASYAGFVNAEGPAAVPLTATSSNPAKRSPLNFMCAIVHLFSNGLATFIACNWGGARSQLSNPGPSDQALLLRYEQKLPPTVLTVTDAGPCSPATTGSNTSPHVRTGAGIS